MDIYQAALSLVIYKQGSVTEFDTDDLLERYRNKQGILIDKTEFLQSLSMATQHYNSRTKCLFVCTEISCLKKSFIDLDEHSLRNLSTTLGCEVELTGCHWVCEAAPILTFKTKADIAQFVDVSSAKAVGEMCTTIKEIVARPENPS